MQIPFIGGAYEERSPSINAQRSINCFPVIDNNESKNIISMYGTPGLKYFTKATSFGSGADGAVTIATGTTLTRNMQYTTLVVNNGVTLNTAGYIITCSVSLTNNGTITDSSSGGAGGIGATGSGNLGTYGADGLYPGVGTGGNGGDGGGNAGIGGNGGKGGGIVRIFARTLTNNGTIHANGSNATAASGDGGCGGGGGNGGVVSLIYDSRTAGTVTATGGTHTDGIANGTNGDEVLLLHGDGINNSTIITDSSLKNHIMTSGGEAVISTSIKKFGTGSIGFTTNDDFVSTPYSTDWYFDIYEFSIDAQVYINTLESIARPICGQYTANNNVWIFQIWSGNGVSFEAWSSGTCIAAYYWTGTITPETWTHVEIDKSDSSSDLLLFIDGTATTWTTILTSIGSNIMPNLSSPLGVGCLPGSSYPSFDGCIDEFCIRKGTTRHTTTFTSPTSPYQPKVDGVDGEAGVVSWVHVTYNAFTTGTFRGGAVINDNLYVAVGANILCILPDGLILLLGSLTTSSGNVFFASDGTRTLVVDGTAYGYYITNNTQVMTAITDIDFPVASSCASMDGFFIVSKKNTNEFDISGLDGAVDPVGSTTWDPTQNAFKEGYSDNLVRVIAANSNIWLFGKETIEIWYNAGTTPFPFARISGALIEDGLASATGVCLIKDQFYFLSNKLQVVRSVGYQREKISTIHIDTAIQSYTTVSDAVAYEYRIDGHTFMVLTFPTQDKTWVYDIDTGYWHEWQSYKTAGVATYGRHRGALGFFFANQWIIGDYINATFYTLDMATYTDAGELIPRTRRAQIIHKDRHNVAHHEIELDFETGVGLVGTGSGSNPQVYLRWSDDGVNTWSGSYAKPLGALGVIVRVRWLRLGKSRNRVYELTMSEPVKFVLVAAYERLEELSA